MSDGWLCKYNYYMIDRIVFFGKLFDIVLSLSHKRTLNTGVVALIAVLIVSITSMYVFWHN